MPRFRFTISGEYDSPVDEVAYGTTDPAAMAKIDEQQLAATPEMFLEEATQFIVRWLP
jgi:hypothetical protein